MRRDGQATDSGVTISYFRGSFSTPSVWIPDAYAKALAPTTALLDWTRNPGELGDQVARGHETLGADAGVRLIRVPPAAQGHDGRARTAPHTTRMRFVSVAGLDPRPDAIIFDVDGVLVDTETSYIEAVVRTPQWLLVHDAGVRDDGPVVDRATVRLWKRTAGWNDDWDLTYAMYCWLLAADGATTTERRRWAEPVESAALRTIPELERAAGARRIRSWEEVRGIFEEIYNSTAVAVERYGVTPCVHQDQGLAATERILLMDDLLSRLATLGIDKVGIVTGRSQLDWSAVASRMALPPDVAVATMEDGRKPDPAPLRKVVRELRARAFLAVGDTRADLELVQRWNESEEGRTIPGTAVMLCPLEDEPSYREAGAALFIGSLAELPALLRGAFSPRATP